MHQSVRELLLHTGARYRLHCPAYCLMPDHAHFLWMGIAASSDQLLASRFFRKHWNLLLARAGAKLQPQAHDRVLRDDEREPGSFEDTVLYIRRNPERDGLVSSWEDWTHAGAAVPGFPVMPVSPASEFWRVFWKIHHLEIRRCHAEGSQTEAACDDTDECPPPL